MDLTFSTQIMVACNYQLKKKTKWFTCSLSVATIYFTSFGSFCFIVFNKGFLHSKQLRLNLLFLFTKMFVCCFLILAECNTHLYESWWNVNGCGCRNRPSEVANDKCTRAQLNPNRTQPHWQPHILVWISTERIYTFIVCNISCGSSLFCKFWSPNKNKIRLIFYGDKKSNRLHCDSFNIQNSRRK